MKKLTIKDLYLNKENYKDKEISISAWVRTVRDSKSFGFIFLSQDVIINKNKNIIIHTPKPIYTIFFSFSSI